MTEKMTGFCMGEYRNWWPGRHIITTTQGNIKIRAFPCAFARQPPKTPARNACVRGGSHTNAMSALFANQWLQNKARTDQNGVLI